MKNLVIVESPTKSKTLQKFLGSNFRVEASMGHIRDLPKSDLGIDVEHNFEPRYIIPKDKTKRVNELKKLALEAQKLWLATDPDREGEAIAWHIKELLKISNSKIRPKSKIPDDDNMQRVVFHEITPEAVKAAFEHPRKLDLKLIDAQQARRVLDRLVGYKLSPVLWKKVKSGLSAGRVQSVALRLIVEREKEVLAFKPVEYWSIEAELESKSKEATSVFLANLIEQNNKKLTIKNQTEADAHVLNLKTAQYQVSKITKKEVRKYPSPPFTTSTLQQTASQRLGMTAKKTMMTAQYLYEHGLITYMRTDSVNLSTSAIETTRKFILENLGQPYLPSQPKVYKTKSKVAQEAHEGIRPTNVGVKSEQLKTMEGMTRDHIRLYELIWKRMVACQMSEAVMDQTSIDIKAENEKNVYLFRTTGSVVKFDGWLKVYGVPNQPKAQTENSQEEVGDEAEKEEEEKDKILPALTEGEILNLLQLLPNQHFTEPPPRFNEASLIKKLEELGIGRPSTYAPTLSTLMDRFYVEKKERKFFPTDLGLAVIKFLMENFPDIIDYSFTAQMENELDEIASGERKWQPTIEQFYTPFAKKINSTMESAERVEVESEVTDKKCPTCGKNLLVKFGKFGKFLACSGFPECKFTQNFEEAVDTPCPNCGGVVVLRKTRKGRPFYGCKNWPTCKYASWTKPVPAVVENPTPPTTPETKVA